MDWKTVGWATLGGLLGALIPVPDNVRFVAVALGAFGVLQLAKADQALLVGAMSVPVFWVIRLLLRSTILDGGVVVMGSREATLLWVGDVATGLTSGALAALLVKGSQPRSNPFLDETPPSAVTPVGSEAEVVDRQPVQQGLGGCGRLFVSLLFGSLGGGAIGVVVGFVALFAYAATLPDDPDGHGMGLEGLAFIIYPMVIGVVVGCFLAYRKLRPKAPREALLFGDDES